MGGEWVEQQLAARRAAAPGPTWRDEVIPGSGQAAVGFDDNGNPQYTQTGAPQTRRVQVAAGGFDEAAVRRELEAQNPHRDQWRTEVALSPEQEQLYRQGVELDSRTGQLALDMLPEAQRVLMQPMATDDADARDRATAGIMSRMEPQFARDRQAMESRLLSQGFQPGTEAYRRAADEHGRNVNDARIQATTAGLGESRAGAAFSNAQRQQRVAELGMIFGLGPGMQMPNQAQLSQVGVNSPDLMGAVQQAYQTKSANHQSGMAVVGQLLGNAARTLPMVNWSDRRLKRDIQRIGTHESGLPVYRFRYIWGDEPMVGFMADEVALLRPDAVYVGASGYAAVDYRAI
jgi:hypothetical protein